MNEVQRDVERANERVLVELDRWGVASGAALRVLPAAIRIASRPGSAAEPGTEERAPRAVAYLLGRLLREVLPVGATLDDAGDLLRAALR